MFYLTKTGRDLVKLLNYSDMWGQQAGGQLDLDSKVGTLQ